MSRWLSALKLPMHRMACAMVVAGWVAGCGDDSSESDVTLTDSGARFDGGDDADGGAMVLGPDGAVGVCCEPDFPSCGCTFHGGWFESVEACDERFGRSTCDASEWSRGTDEWGCPIVIPGPGSCLEPPPSYESCTFARGCADPRDFCADDELTTSLGGADDPISSHPDGEDTFVDRRLFPDGTCTPSFPGSFDECDPADPTAVCDTDGTCAELELGRVCLQACTDSGECRDGYRCDPDLGGCIGACRSDDECRVRREETNGIEGLQPAFLCAVDSRLCRPTDCSDAEPADPEACADPEGNFDRLVYDTESTAVCDPETLRCTE